METGSILATIESIKQMEDALVAEIIVEFFKTLSPSKSQKYQKLTNGLTFQERMQKT